MENKTLKLSDVGVPEWKKFRKKAPKSKLKKGMEKQISDEEKQKLIKKWNDVRTDELYKRKNKMFFKNKKSDKELAAEKKLYELGAGTAYKPKD